MGDLLIHLECDAVEVGRLVGPIVTRGDASIFGAGILRGQMQGRDVEENQVAGPVGVQLVKGIEDTVDKVLEGDTGVLTTGEELAVAKIVGTDPDGVDGIVAG